MHWRNPSRYNLLGPEHGRRLLTQIQHATIITGNSVLELMTQRLIIHFLLLFHLNNLAFVLSLDLFDLILILFLIRLGLLILIGLSCQVRVVVILPKSTVMPFDWIASLGI